MKYSQNSISTETKVAFGILALTAGIIITGITLFKNSGAGAGKTLSEETVMKNIDTNIAFNKEAVSPAANPKITGTGKGTATTSTSTLPIEVTEFLDYECPACAVQGEYITKKLLELYGSRVVITRRIFPVHGAGSIEIGRMVLAAQETSPEAYQNLHTKVMETQSTWAPLGTKDRVTFFRKLTAGLGLDYDKLVADGKTSKYASQIDQDKSDAVDLGIRATPSFIINYKTRFTGAIPPQYLEKFVDVR